MVIVLVSFSCWVIAMGCSKQKLKPSPPPKPNRPAKRKQWTNEIMHRAMAAVQEKDGSSNRAAKLLVVPVSTLQDHMSGHVVHGVKPGPVPYLPPEKEDELEEYFF